MIHLFALRIIEDARDIPLMKQSRSLLFVFKIIDQDIIFAFLSDDCPLSTDEARLIVTNSNILTLRASKQAFESINDSSHSNSCSSNDGQLDCTADMK